MFATFLPFLLLNRANEKDAYPGGTRNRPTRKTQARETTNGKHPRRKPSKMLRWNQNPPLKPSPWKQKTGETKNGKTQAKKTQQNAPLEPKPGLKPSPWKTKPRAEISRQSFSPGVFFFVCEIRSDYTFCLPDLRSSVIAPVV